jgi:hypothetical protein
MSDTDKAAREYAKQFRAGRPLASLEAHAIVDFKAGASHERSRPLTSDEAEELAREACRLMAETDTLEAHGHAIYAALQCMRSPKP